MEGPKPILTAAQLGVKGAKKRNANLSPERRSEIARIAGSNKGKKDYQELHMMEVFPLVIRKLIVG